MGLIRRAISIQFFNFTLTARIVLQRIANYVGDLELENPLEN